MYANSGSVGILRERVEKPGSSISIAGSGYELLPRRAQYLVSGYVLMPATNTGSTGVPRIKEQKSGLEDKVSELKVRN